MQTVFWPAEGGHGRKADQIRCACGGNNRPVTANNFRVTMRFACLCTAAVILGVAFFAVAAKSALAQSADAKAADPRSPSGENGKDGLKKIDNYAEAERLLGAPAGNPECVWLGRRVVSLLWRDDLDTAFRHLDLYDRFGCPAGHIQTAFRCVVRLGPIDAKAPDSLNGRIHDCWNNPGGDSVMAPAAAAAAAAPAQAQ